MAIFTLELSEVVRLTHGSIGLDTYPIFDDSYRAGLNDKIIAHYFNQEIGVETVDMFRQAMRRKMNEIMPFYNKLYESEALAFNPFVTIKMHTEGTDQAVQAVENNGTSTTTTGSESGSRSVVSETPQTMLAGNGDYATSANDVKSKSAVDATGTEVNNANTTATNDTVSDVEGYQRIPADLLMAFRQTLLNIDMLIINDLNELFMQIWNTSDNYTKHGYGY